MLILMSLKGLPSVILHIGSLVARIKDGSFIVAVGSWLAALMTILAVCSRTGAWGSIAAVVESWLGPFVCPLIGWLALIGGADTGMMSPMAIRAA